MYIVFSKLFLSFPNPGSVGMLEQIKGIGMVPKRAMDVMNAEVNRLLVLTKNAVIPVPYQVPRKVSHFTQYTKQEHV